MAVWSHREALGAEDRRRVRELVAAGGLSVGEVAVQVGCSRATAYRVLQEATSRARPRAALRLSVMEREEIAVGLAAGESMAVIARRLGRAPSTVSREVAANGGRGRYRAVKADQRAGRLTGRPKVCKLSVSGPLRDEVVAMLRRRWSPQQISRALTLQFPTDLEMRVSHETIYQSLFVQGKGALRKELTVALRSGRARRRRGGSPVPGPRIKGMVMISERPAEVEDRAVPGHWEGDLICGKNNKSAIVTLVERQTRFVMLARIGEDRSSAAVCEAITAKIQTLPGPLAKTLTWDQGRELARHAQITISTGLQVYFCDPHSPWQRGTNENTNGLLRQYFPKGTDLALHDQTHLDAVALELNERPRMTLDWRTPHERLNELLAMTD